MKRQTSQIINLFHRFLLWPKLHRVLTNVQTITYQESNQRTSSFLSPKTSKMIPKDMGEIQRVIGFHFWWNPY